MNTPLHLVQIFLWRCLLCGLLLASAHPATAALQSDTHPVYLPFTSTGGEETPAPKLLAPADDAQLDTLIPYLQYDFGAALSKGGCACLALGTTPTPAQCTASFMLGEGSDHGLVPALNLLPNTLYYWRVGLYTENRVSILWSAVWSFKTGSGGTLPPAPKLTSPTDGSTVTVTSSGTTSVTFKWQAVPGAVGYILYIHALGSQPMTVTEMTSSTQLVEEHLSSYVHAGYGQHYEWWVVARNLYAWGTSSPAWDFNYTEK